MSWSVVARSSMQHCALHAHERLPYGNSSFPSQTPKDRCSRYTPVLVLQLRSKVVQPEERSFHPASAHLPALRRNGMPLRVMWTTAAVSYYYPPREKHVGDIRMPSIPKAWPRSGFVVDQLCCSVENGLYRQRCSKQYVWR